jgi:hypothetical protein
MKDINLNDLNQNLGILQINMKLVLYVCIEHVNENKVKCTYVQDMMMECLVAIVYMVCKMHT